MASAGYKQAYSEVLDILSHTRKEDVDKISSEFMNYLKENSLKNYTSSMNHSLKINDMNLNPKTKAVLAIIYRKFWCDEEQQKNFDEKLKHNEIAYQKNKKDINQNNNYDLSHIKKENNTQRAQSNLESQDNTSSEMTPYKESIFTKIINKIKLIFKK